jgi:hypothetical protein
MENKFLEEVKKRRVLRLKELEEAERQSKNTKQRLADLDFEVVEAKRLLARNEKFEVELRRRQVEELRKKPGAKWKWKGELGYHLICAVKALTADGTTPAQACRDLHYWARCHSNPKAKAQATRWVRFEQLVGEHWQYLRDECCQKPRQLEARYCDALKAWGPYFERDAALDAEMERSRAISAGTDQE